MEINTIPSDEELEVLLYNNTWERVCEITGVSPHYLRNFVHRHKFERGHRQGVPCMFKTVLSNGTYYVGNIVQTLRLVELQKRNRRFIKDGLTLPYKVQGCTVTIYADRHVLPPHYVQLSTDVPLCEERDFTFGKPRGEAKKHYFDVVYGDEVLKLGARELAKKLNGKIYKSVPRNGEWVEGVHKGVHYKVREHEAVAEVPKVVEAPRQLADSSPSAPTTRQVYSREALVRHSHKGLDAMPSPFIRDMPAPAWYTKRGDREYRDNVSFTSGRLKGHFRSAQVLLGDYYVGSED